MFKNKKTTSRKNFLDFLIDRIKLHKNIEFPLSKVFLKRYKKLNKQSFDLSKLKNKN